MLNLIILKQNVYIIRFSVFAQVGSLRIFSCRASLQSDSSPHLRQLRIIRHHRGPSVGTVEHRELRRQQIVRHSVGTQSGRHARNDTDRRSSCQRSLRESMDIQRQRDLPGQRAREVRASQRAVPGIDPMLGRRLPEEPESRGTDGRRAGDMEHG